MTNRNTEEISPEPGFRSPKTRHISGNAAPSPGSRSDFDLNELISEFETQNLQDNQGDEPKADLGVEGGTLTYNAYPRRLRLHQIRQLARSLHTPANHQSNVAGSRRLRLTHIKRLARSLKSDKRAEA